MPWYKLEFDAGKGHTQHHEKYVWSDYEWDDKDKRAEWDDWTRDFGYEFFRNGDTTRLDKLPDNIKKNKIEFYQSRIKESQRMIDFIDNESSECNSKAE